MTSTRTFIILNQYFAVMTAIRNKTHKKKFIKSVAAESINILLKEAENNYIENPKRTDNYIKMIWDVVKKYKIKLTEEQKTKFCRKCQVYWVPTKTLNIAFNTRLNVFEFICKKCGYKKIINKKETYKIL